jgi:hypothetical protein
MRKVITLKVPSALFQLLLLNVRITAAVVFLAPAGTLSMFGFLIQSFGHWPA